MVFYLFVEVDTDVNPSKKCKLLKSLICPNTSSAETSLLSHGFNFAPSNKPDPFVLFKDLKRYVRNLTLKRVFQIKSTKNAPNTDSVENSTILEPSLESHEFDFNSDMIEML